MQSESIILNIKELEKENVLRLIDKPININLFYFTINDQMNINVYNLYYHLQYYPEYKIVILDMKQKEIINNFIDLNLDNLTLFKGINSFNFNFQIILYDTIKKEYLPNTEVVFKLLNDKQTILIFSDIETEKIIPIFDLNGNDYKIEFISPNILLDNVKVVEDYKNIKVKKGNYEFIFNIIHKITKTTIKQYYYKVK